MIAAPLLATLAAISFWLSAGTIAVMNGDASRIAALPPIWILGLAVVGAVALAVVVRLRTENAWPLALSLFIWLPYLPGPVPPAFLMFAGPVRWIIWALVIAGLFVAHPPRMPAWGSRPRIASWIVALLLVLFSVTVFRAVPDVIPGGDEPHYLAATQSLIKDGDLKVANNYASGDYLQYFPGRLEPHFLARSASGEIYSIHAPGVSVVVLPAFALAGYDGAVLTMVLCAALMAALLWRVTFAVAGSASGAWLGVAGVVFTAPYFFHTFTIYPEIIGSVCVTVALWLLLALDDDRDVTVGQLVASSCAFALLPWLHSRFAVLAALCGLFVIARLWTKPSRWGRIASFLAVPVVAGAAWFAFFWIIWGSPSPAAPYGADTSTSLSYIVRGVIGLLIDQQFGVIATAPVLVLSFVGLPALARKRPRLTAELAIVVVAYTAAVASYAMWWGGAAAPGRFLVAILPLAALPMAFTASATLSWVLLVVSMSMVVPRGFVEGGRLIYTVRSTFDATVEWLSVHVDLAQAVPSVHRDGGLIAVRDGAVWLVCLAIAAVAIARMGALTRGARWTLTSAALGLVAMVSITAVWAVHGAEALRPERSRLTAFGAYYKLLSVRLVLAGQLPESVRSDTSRLSLPESTFLQSLSTGIAGPAARVNRLPAGEYDLRLTPGISAATVTLSVGRNDPPFDTLTLTSGMPTRVRFAAPLQVLNVRSPAAFDGTWLTLTPVATGMREITTPVIHAGRYGRVRAFFFDERAYPERDGFWTRADERTTVLIDTDDVTLTPGLPVVFAGRAVPTTVRLAVGGWKDTIALAAGQSRPVTLPASERGVWAMRMESGHGFHPFEREPGNRDVRDLAAWVTIP